jgi:aminoglycoside 2''-phosphotransferase
MPSFKKIRKIIQNEFPDFFISSIKKIGEGDNSKAFLINKDYIFRFPKTEKAKQDLKTEIAVLPKIFALIDLSIPQPEFISKELNFVSYKSILGKSLTTKIYTSSGKKIQKQIIKALGIFLTQLHQIDLSTLKDCGLQTMNYWQEYLDNFTDAKKLIYPNIKHSEKEKITQLFINYFNDQKKPEYKTSLIHNDFSSNHILFKKKLNKISGIIDFGDLAFGDPDYDLMYLLDSFGEDFIRKLLKYYPHNDHKSLLEKLHFFSLANKIQILIGSIKENDEYGIKEGYKNLKKWLKKYPG